GLPGRLPAGRRIGGPAGVIDVMPTILDLLDVPAPPALQGRSLVTRLGGDPTERAEAVSEYSQATRRYERLRRGGLTYIVAGSTELLFDAARDPGEQTNLVPAEPALVEPMRTALARWRASCPPLATRFGAQGSVLPS